MEPTIKSGQELTAVLYPDSATAIRSAKRGELVVYAWPPDTSKRFIKRIVGAGGDTLAMTEGVLFLNGARLAEPYAWHADSLVDPVPSELKWMVQYYSKSAKPVTPPSRNNWGPLVVPSEAFFVLGDNRDNSLDSRYWGFLFGNHLVGHVQLERGHEE